MVYVLRRWQSQSENAVKDRIFVRKHHSIYCKTNDQIYGTLSPAAEKNDRPYIQCLILRHPCVLQAIRYTLRYHWLDIIRHKHDKSTAHIYNLLQSLLPKLRILGSNCAGTLNSLLLGPLEHIYCILTRSKISSWVKTETRL